MFLGFVLNLCTHHCKHIHSLLLLKLISSSVMNMLHDDDDSWKGIKKINKWKRKDTCFNRIHGNTGHCCFLVCWTFEYDILFSYSVIFSLWMLKDTTAGIHFSTTIFISFISFFCPLYLLYLESLFISSFQRHPYWFHEIPFPLDGCDGWMDGMIWYNNNVGIKESSCWLLGLIM